MINSALFSILLFGSIIASYYDLKTTEVPNKVFYFIISLSLPFLVYKFFLSGLIFHYLIAFSVLGFALYKLGQWGGADATLLAISGLLIQGVPENFFPKLVFDFQISFLFNLFILGAIYMLIFSFFISLKHKKFWKEFFEDLKNLKKFFLFLFFFCFISSIFIFSFLGLQKIQSIFISLSISFSTIFLFVLAKFVLGIERRIFKRKIHISKLKVGDMLLEKRELVGIKKEELEMIKSSGKKFVWIKEGVRFIPSFPIALIFTILYGDFILLFPIF